MIDIKNTYAGIFVHIERKTLLEMEIIMKENLLVNLPALPESFMIPSEKFGFAEVLCKEFKENEGINDRESFFKHAELLQKVTRLLGREDEIRKDFLKDFNLAVKLIREAGDLLCEDLTELKSQLKKLLSDYFEREHLRLLKSRLQLDSMRKAYEKELEALSRIAVEKLGSDTVTYNFPDIFKELEEGPLKCPYVAVRRKLDFELVDESLLPDCFFSPDPAKIKIWLAERKDELMRILELNPESGMQFMPGLKVKITTDVSSR